MMNKGSVDYERWQQLKESSRSTILSPRNDRVVRRARTPLIGKSGRDIVGNSYSNLELSNSRKKFVGNTPTHNRPPMADHKPIGISGTKRDLSITRSMKRGPTINSQKTEHDTPMSKAEKTPFEKECQDLALKEKNLMLRLEVLEKEKKSFKSLVRKSEKHIEDALKKAEEEENKIFSLFLDVMKEKNIEINLDDSEEEQKDIEENIKDLR
jgi:hypothetical protein